jgi:hypothetical protein
MHGRQSVLNCWGVGPELPVVPTAIVTFLRSMARAKVGSLMSITSIRESGVPITIGDDPTPAPQGRDEIPEAGDRRLRARDLLVEFEVTPAAG